MTQTPAPQGGAQVPQHPGGQPQFGLQQSGGVQEPPQQSQFGQFGVGQSGSQQASAALQQPLAQQGVGQVGAQMERQIGAQQGSAGIQQPVAQQGVGQAGAQMERQIGAQPSTGQITQPAGQQQIQAHEIPSSGQLQSLQATTSPEVQVAVGSLDQLETAAEVVDGQAGHQGNSIVANTADAIKDVAHMQKEFLLEQNPMTELQIGSTQQLLQGGMENLSQYGSQAETQELIAASRNTIDALDSVRQSGQLEQTAQSPTHQQVQGAATGGGLTQGGGIGPQ